MIIQCYRCIITPYKYVHNAFIYGIVDVGLIENVNQFIILCWTVCKFYKHCMVNVSKSTFCVIFKNFKALRGT